jgi:hypothetical protein
MLRIVILSVMVYSPMLCTVMLTVIVYNTAMLIVVMLSVQETAINSVSILLLTRCYETTLVGKVCLGGMNLIITTLSLIRLEA